MLLPIRKFEKLRIESIKYNKRFIHTTCICGLIVGIFPLIEMLPQITKIFFNASDLTETLSEIHDEAEKDIGLSSFSLFLCRIELLLYDLCFIFIYPLLKETKKNKLAIAGVIVVVAVCVLRSILSSGRTALFNLIVHTSVIIVIYIPLFKKYERKKILKYFFLIIGIAGVFFSVITIARSNKYTEKESNYSLPLFISRYAGEGFLNYNNFAFEANETLGGVMTFNSFQEMIGLNPPKITREYLYGIASQKTRIPQNVFYTYIGVFVIDIGPIWTAVFLMLVTFIVHSLIPKNASFIPIHSIFLLVCYLKVLEFGIIGYCYTGSHGYFIFFYLVMYAVMRLQKT